MKTLYLKLLVVLLFLIAAALLISFLSLSSAENKLTIELKPLHPGFANMQIKDQEAWQELFRRTKFSEIKSISYGKDTLKIEKPITKIILEITDEKQNNYVFAEAANTASSASVSLKDDILEVKMFINEDLVGKTINYLIHDTFWLIAQSNIPPDTNINYLIYESKKYLQNNNLQLISLR